MNKTSINQVSSDSNNKFIARFVFAHGAGAGQDSDFMRYYAEILNRHGIDVVRFNFPYMQLMVETGNRRPPDRAPKLLEYYKHIIEQQDNDLPLFIGGKSMGGRIASMLLQESKALGAICMGYPFHPPGKPEKLRTEHLVDIEKPVLILQGERDTFGTRDEVSQYALSKHIQLTYLPDGDHSFKPRKSSGLTVEQNLMSGVDQLVAFIRQNIC